MILKIISQTEKLFEDEVKEIYAPTTTGEIGILPKHSNLITLLDIGILKVKLKNSKVKLIPINGGLLKVSRDEIIVLAQEATLPEHIIEKEIDEAIENAQKKISSKLPPSELIQLEKQIRYEKLKRKVREKLS